MSDTISVQRFDDLKACFQSLGTRLSNDQLLELADLYHDLLRWRRQNQKTSRLIQVRSRCTSRADQNRSARDRAPA